MLGINSKLKYNKENLLIITFSIFFYATSLVDIFRLLSQSYVPQLSSYIEIIRNCIYIGILGIVVVLIIHSKINKNFLFITLITLILLCISIIINNDLLNIVIPFMFYFLSRCLTGFYLVINIGDFSKLLVYLAKFKWIMLLYSLLIIIVYSNLSDSYSKSSYMSISYNLLQISMVMLIFGVIFKKRIYYLYHFYLVMLILIYGARGTLICLAGFYTILFILNRKKKIDIKYLIRLFICLFLVSISLISIPNILIFLESKFIFSRNLSLINSENLFDYSNRLIQYSGFIKEIIKNPLIFRGLLSDRFLMAELYNTEVSYNLYPHNIFLEIIYQNGLILGIIILLNLFLQILLKIKVIKSKEIEKYMFALFIPVPIINLMFSGSYLISYTFWMALGYLLNKTRRYDYEKSNN